MKDTGINIHKLSSPMCQKQLSILSSDYPLVLMAEALFCLFCQCKNMLWNISSLFSPFHISPFWQFCLHYCLLKVFSAAEPHCFLATHSSLRYFPWYLPNVFGANVVINGLINCLFGSIPGSPLPPPYPWRDWNWTFLVKTFTTVCCLSRSRVSDAFNLPSFQ